jgi:AraC-like DNA-binding protein
LKGPVGTNVEADENIRRACEGVRAVSFPVERLSLRTRDIGEAIGAVGRIYCPHSIAPVGRVRNVDAALEVTRPGRQPIVYLRYSTPVVVDAGNFPNLLLMMTASTGAAEVDQNSRCGAWHAGQTMPLSAGLDTHLRFDRNFSQTSVRVDIDQLEQMCGRWLGHPLSRPIRFALHPFRTELERAWREAMHLAISAHGMGDALPGAASRSLDEFMLSLLIHGHPHNFSDELCRPPAPACRPVVLEAERIFRERATTGTTVSEVAMELGVSVRSLQAGFREARQTTPSAFLRRARLDAAHRAFRLADPTISVTDVALTLGFAHMGRFSAAYKAVYAETPVSTLRRGRRSRK